MDKMQRYQTPRIVDYGDVKEITEANAIPAMVDVPQGTPVGLGPIVGDNLSTP